VFCRVCGGCAAHYTDEHGDLSTEAMERYCARQFKACSELLVLYIEVLLSNPDCLAYMDEIMVT
jgi:hypothetical protein